MLSNFVDVDVVAVIVPVHVEDAGDVAELVHVSGVLLCVASKLLLSIAVILSNISFPFPETFRGDEAEKEDEEEGVEGPGDGDVPGAGVEASSPASSRRGGQAEPFWSTMFCWPSPPTS